MEDNGLRVCGLQKTYANGVKALNGIDFSVDSGLYGLLGPNGAGKSTLMRTLATLQMPDAGQIYLDGVDVLQRPEFLRERLGYLPQTIGAYPAVSGRDLLLRFAWLKGQDNAKARQAEVDALLEKVNLSAAAGRAVAGYSGGMLRRFGIAVALLASPRLIIVDEPTAGLDPAERNRFHRVLADVADKAIVLLSTHIVEDIENLCERLAIVAQGKIIAAGSPAELTAPYQGKLWQCVIGKGEPLPDAVQLTASPRGTTATVLADQPPNANYQAHLPTLEDAYHLALAQAGLNKDEV